MVNFFIWLIAGVAIGGLATLIMRRRNSILLLNISMGIVGIFVAGFLLPPLFHISTSSLPGFLVSLGGTIILLVVVNFLVVREHTVSNTVIQSQWNQVRDKIHVRWGKISEEDVDQIDGNHDRFINLLEERYGIDNGEAEDQLQRFLRAVINKISWSSLLHHRAQDANPSQVHTS